MYTDEEMKMRDRFTVFRRCRPIMCAALVAFGLAATEAATSSAAPPRAHIHYHNPVFAQDFPDPMVLRANAHSYYAYGTTTGWEHGYFPILHSTDLVHWRYVSDVFKIPPSWSNNDFWAPDVIKHAGTYYVYYTGLGPKGHCIGVATGKKPTGPFKQQRVVGCGDASGNGYIDPAIYQDKAGKAYLYVSVDDPEHNISVIPLTKDMLHAAGPRHKLFGITQPWEHGTNFSTVEGPFVILHSGTYYLFFSGNDWRGGYSMGYATASSPMGPFTPYGGNPILRGNSHVKGPGGGSIVQGADGKLWMLYHAWKGPEGYDAGGIRNMRLDRVMWSGANAMIPVTPS